MTKEKDSGAELAAVGNDTGSSPTETASRRWNDDDTNAHLLSDLARTLRESTGTHREIGVTLSRIEAVEAGRDALLAQEQLARGFIELWNDIGIQDAADWLYVAYNTAERVLAGNQPAPSGIASPAASPAQKDTVATARIDLASAIGRFRASGELDGVSDAIDALIAAVRAEAQPMWQKIDTAPKDGTWVLLYCPGGVGCVVAAYMTLDIEWWFVDTGKEEWPLRGPSPTHWMPLPEPPK